MKYQKTDILDVVQFLDNADNLKEISDMLGEDFKVDYANKENPILIIGGQKAKIGDYVCRGNYGYGEAFIVKKDDFIGYYPCNTPQERMKIEIDELVERFAKLSDFMKTDKFLSLPNEIIGLLEAQYGAMMAYNHVLQLRLQRM